MTDASKPASFAAFTAFWLKIGCLSFGGPAGQIAMMQSELVDRLRWVDQRRFLHVLNFCMLLPGPEAQQLATYLGWRLYGIIGGVVSGGLFILPGAAAMMGLAWLTAAHGETPIVAAVFSGIKPVVVAIIFAAAWRVGKRALTTHAARITAAAAFISLFFLQAPFPLVVLAAGVLGATAARLGRHWFAPVSHGGHAAEDAALSEDAPPRLDRLLWLILVFMALWAAPLLVITALFGDDPWRALGLFFTKAAFVTFGGAYAVLPYVAQQAVESFGWLTPAQMLDGLALAETTPGPLILVLQYVGFFAGWGDHGAQLTPLQGGLLGAAITLWATFLPCFFFIFAGAPYVERLIHNKTAAGALAAITAAVVGVVIKLGVYLGLAVLIPAGSPDYFAGAVSLAALAALTRGGVALHWTVMAGAAVGALQWGVAAASL